MWTRARTYQNSHVTPPKMPHTLSRLSKKKTPLRNVTEQCCSPGGGGGEGGFCHIWAVFAAVKGMVFKQFTLG